LSAPARSDRERLIASRLRQTASAAAPTHLASVPPIDVDVWLAGDLGHLHRAYDLAHVRVSSHRRITGRAVVALKRTMRRLLFPLIDIQSGVNGANARVVTMLLQHAAAQARAIGELEREVAELRAEREP
jgi:hypothetical protein